MGLRQKQWCPHRTPCNRCRCVIVLVGKLLWGLSRRQEQGRRLCICGAHPVAQIRSAPGRTKFCLLRVEQGQTNEGAYPEATMGRGYAWRGGGTHEEKITGGMYSLALMTIQQKRGSRSGQAGCGAGERNRTSNLRFTKPLLCRLSYASPLVGNLPNSSKAAAQYQ